MGRESCGMCHTLPLDELDEVYCDYYDVFYMRCVELKVCPDGLDDEDFDYDEEYDEDEGTTEELNEGLTEGIK